MPSRILVFGGWFGSKNIGDDAILIGIKNVFEKFSSDISFVAFSSDSKQKMSAVLMRLILEILARHRVHTLILTLL